MPAESFTLAAAQVEPVSHDKEATLDKTCRWIAGAGDEGADLVVFPETYFPGYPYWRGSVSIPRWTDLMVELQKNSLHVDDDAVDVLGEAAADADVHVALGTNELSDRRGERHPAGRRGRVTHGRFRPQRAARHEGLLRRDGPLQPMGRGVT